MSPAGKLMSLALLATLIADPVMLGTTATAVPPTWVPATPTTGASNPAVVRPTGAATVPASRPPAGTVAVPNGGFEATPGSAARSIPDWHTQGTAHAATASAPGHTGGHALTHTATAAYRVDTTQRVTGLAPGYYTVGGYIQSGGGQRYAYLSATTRGQTEARTALPVAGAWTHLSIRGVHVTDGALTIGLHTAGPAGTSARLDDVEITGGAPYDFLAGGDVTMANWVTDSGGRYYDAHGVRRDPLQIMADNGADIVRLRLYNGTGPAHPSLGTPSQYLPKGYQDENDMVDLARRATRLGMKTELTFHYSDWWTNGSTADLPADWRYVTKLPDARAVDELEKLVHDYTKRVLRRLAAQGSTPQFVSLGNEMQGGILYPYGSSWRTGAVGQGNLARFLKAGYRAVKEVSPTTRVIIHVDEAGNYDKYRWFLGLLKGLGVPYDVIGSSYYPFWSLRDVAAVKEFFATISREFGKKIMVMETGVNWSPVTRDGVEGQLHDNGPVPYGETPAGQRDFLYELFAALKDVPDGAVIGALYWDPVMIPAKGVGWAVGGDNVVSNTTLFDFAGKALPAFAAYHYNTDPVPTNSGPTNSAPAGSRRRPRR